MKHPFRNCPVCLNNTVEVLHTQKFAIINKHPLPNEYDIVWCKECGFVYADTYMTQDQYNTYYQNFSKYQWGGTTKWYDENISSITKYIIDKNSSILDIGCANGELLLELKNRGYKNLIGLDPSDDSIENTLSKNINAIKGEIFSLNTSFYNQKFDFIILSHVLEHIYDLQIAVDNIVDILNDNGLLYIEVPDASRYNQYYIVPFHYFDSEHINHFDEISLQNLFIPKNCTLINYSKKESFVSNKIYPAVYTIHQKTTHNSKKVITPPNNLRNQIISYIKKSQMNDKWPEIDKLSLTKEPIVIWGTGSYTSRLIATSSLGHCNISFFVDKDHKKENLSINNIPIHLPSCLFSHHGPIIISSALYSDEILEEIKEMKLQNEIIIMD